MAAQKNEVSKDVKYNQKGREALFRVEITTADSDEDAEKMRQMKTVIVAKSGSAKKGVNDMYDFCQKEGFFDK